MPRVTNRRIASTIAATALAAAGFVAGTGTASAADASGILAPKDTFLVCGQAGWNPYKCWISFFNLPIAEFEVPEGLS
ncbi:hypothetical protein [Rhodococcus sp. Q]|uniref:hypothetical protein n=1 Tax=Rhodococcus sp. Q TaxID=2502252 RepID=UPI0010F80091|nr:hypothetical protein [Rhodococcus sp. Q]